MFDILSYVLSFSSRIPFLLWPLLTILGHQVSGQSLKDKFHIDSLFPSNVSDTLNVKEFAFDNWVVTYKGDYRLNAVHSTHNYHPTYPSSVVRSDLGNMGSAASLNLFEENRGFGFRYRDARRGYWKGIQDRVFLLSDRMFSNVQYSNGVNRENYLVANLTRGFGKLLDLGFRFNRINSEGFYDRQQNTITDFTIYSAFRSNDNRYRALIMFNYLNLKTEENGGLSNDTIFESNSVSGRNFVPINLTNAMNHWKGFEIGLNHRFILTKQDSLSKPKKYVPAISHSFSVNRHSMVYHDVPDTSSAFYENVYLDSAITYDSTNVLGVSNTFRFELLKTDSIEKVLNRIAVGVNHHYIRISYDSIFSENIHNLSVLGEVNGRLFKKVNWQASGQFMFFGYNIWDLKVDGKFDYQVKKSTFRAFVDYNLYRPDYITDVYTSNHFAWNNDWVQTQHLQTGLAALPKRFRVERLCAYR